MQILSDANFENEYKAIIAPFCEQNEVSGYFESRDGKRMHYLSYINSEARANILILHGFTESAKKFDEMAYYFFNEGFSVYSLDLRGHGLSYKDKAPAYGVDSQGFEYYADDIADFVDKIISDEKPLYCYTHSLGGNAALLSIMKQSVKFDGLVLSSPMICGNMGMPVAIAEAVAKLVNKIGKGDMPAPGKCIFEPEAGNKDATSIERGDFWLRFKKENPEYQTCGPTFRWVLNSLKARDEILKDENISKINCPILVIKPFIDEQLLEKYQDVFIDKCRQAQKNVLVVKTQGTYHEIYQSKQAQLESYIETILSFIG